MGAVCRTGAPRAVSLISPIWEGGRDRVEKTLDLQQDGLGLNRGFASYQLGDDAVA